ncbi:MAG: DUF72 domain-containing protein [Candidatus Zixiibacteriota bacterium]|nr:MAG: DUF72 domain-containing protein [candidate division Zixibacteria bacterium]
MNEPSDTAADPGLLRLGTSSFSETDWVGPFYPRGTKPAEFLAVYARHFDTVEIDSTYYAVPSATTVDGWAEKTPGGFTFAAKFPAAIVHAGEGPTPDSGRVLAPDHVNPVRDRFLEVISRLGDKLGPLLIQFPWFSKEVFPDSGVFFERLDRFLAGLPREYRYAVEIRNRQWMTPDLAGLCRDHHAALVLADYASMPLGYEVEKRFDPVTADFSYIRLIGHRKQIEAITTRWDREVIDRGKNLEAWAGLIGRFAARRVLTYIFINNHYAGHAPATLRRLGKLVFGEGWGEEVESPAGRREGELF